MFANLSFQILDYFNITSNETVKMAIALFLAILIFGVFYTVIKFTGIKIDNLNQNVIGLLTVDIISFIYLMYKRKNDKPLENTNQESTKKDAPKIEIILDDVVEQVNNNDVVEQVNNNDVVEQVNNNDVVEQVSNEEQIIPAEVISNEEETLESIPNKVEEEIEIEKDEN